MPIRRHTSRSTVSISNRVNSANLAIIYSTPTKILEYLSVAGGGAGGYYQYAAGGGAGGYLTGNIDITGITGKVITITVGAGGATSTQQTIPGSNGSNSNISASFIGILEAVGGGGGGSRNNSVSGPGTYGQNGGSGGGGVGAFGLALGGFGYPGQGNSSPPCPASFANGSGGGAGAPGVLYDAGTTAYPGGNGLQSSISGTLVYRAGGGGHGRGPSGTPLSIGGLGGGGDGGSFQGGTPATSGLANYGGGGGGAGPQGDPGGAGGSGVVILRYANSFANASYTGSNVVYTNTGGYHTYRFYTSGTITI